MSSDPTAPDEAQRQLIARAQLIVAHAWMVRAFVRHSNEVEDFPELHDIGRAVFDIARALETRIDDPPGYLRMLGKKLAKFRLAVQQFATDAPKASAHTNFAMAVISIKGCVTELEAIVAASR